MKQIVYDRFHKGNDMNFGIEFKIANRFQFNSTIIAAIDIGKIVTVNLFDIEKKRYILNYNGVRLIYIAKIIRQFMNSNKKSEKPFDLKNLLKYSLIQVDQILKLILKILRFPVSH
jgi:hypothetical protein